MLSKIAKFPTFATSFKHCKVYFGQEARLKMYEGIKQVNQATQVTLGPKGRNVAIEYEVGAPRITKDGVTVAKNVSFGDNFKEAGASLIRQASGQTNMYAGDGTTTSTLITTSIINAGLKYLQQGVNPIEMKRGMDKARNEIIEFLQEIKQEVDIQNEEDKQKTLEHLSAVCTNYDPLLTKIISETLSQIGHDGNVEIEPGQSFDTEVFFTNGVGLARPFASPEFVKDKGTNSIELNYPLVLCANQEITLIKQIVPAIELAKKAQKQLFIIAQDISKEVMSNLIYNQKNGQIEMCAITVPGMGDYSSIVIEDLALITGGKLFDQKTTDIEQIKMNDFGKSHKVVSNAQETFIFGGTGNEEQIKSRMIDINREITKTSKEFQKKLLRDRLGRLSGKMAIVLIGGANEYEMMETRDKVIDAFNAVKLAMKNGYLPGGGTSLLRASQILDLMEPLNYDQKCGIQVVKEAIQEPIIQLHKNNERNGKLIIEDLLTKYNEDINIGYNLNTEKYENMIDAGIIDSFSITQSALIDSISIGSMILTTEVALIKDKKYRPPKVNTYKKDIF